MKGKTGKWLLLVAAVLTIVLSVSPALAAEEAPTPIFSTSVTKVNPLYASGDAPPVYYSMMSPTTYVADNFMLAAYDLRSAMMDRKTDFMIVFPVTLESSLEDQAALEAELLLCEEALFQIAVEHGESGWLGDYLLFSHYLRAVDIAVAQEDGITAVAISYQIIYNDTKEQEEAVTKAVKALTSSWNLSNATDFEKVCVVYDWLCENVTYPEVITEECGVIFSAYGALVNRVSVCQGYALAMYRLLLELDVDCRIISGIGAGGPHAWNIVKIGDYYYNLDATWDAALHQAGLDYGWFLTSDADFPEHERDPQYMSESFYAAYPMAQESYAISVLASGTCGDDLNWVLLDERTFMIVGTGPMYDYTEETQPWKAYQDQIGRVYMDSGVTDIGDYAFANCKKLENVLIPDGVTEIGDYAFYYCYGLNDITIPAGVVSIGDSAFHASGLKTVKLPEGLKTIGNSAFSWCSDLYAVSIPKSLTIISELAFFNCGLGSIELPEGVVAIENSAFNSCDNLQYVMLPESLRSIGNGAFGYCTNLTEIIMPEVITNIGAEAFDQCQQLTEITIPAGLTSIADRVFSGTGITSIIIPESVTSIGASAFSGTQLTGITIPESVTSIGESVFFGCSKLTSATLPKSITAISDDMFKNSGLTGMVIPEHVSSIGNGAFSGCKSLTGVTIPESVTSIGINAFADCVSMTEFTFSKSITSISAGMFQGSGLISVTIPEHVISIGDNAFNGCTSLVNVTVPESVTGIGGGAFANCTSMTGFTFPKSITSISAGMFQGSGLISMTIPDHITSIGPNAFNECKSLVSITIPEGITSIENGTFCHCEALKTITIPKSVTNIGNIAFGCWTGLNEIRFLGDAPTFDHSAFYTTVATAYYPEGNLTWTEDVRKSYGGQIRWVAEESRFFQPVGSSISLGEGLDFHFFLSGDDVTNTDYAVITRTYADGREDHVLTVPYADWNTLEDGTVYVTYPNIAAKEMGDAVSVVIYNAESKAVSEVRTDSIEAYAMRMLETKTEPELLTLLVDMLNYGTEAQKYFEYDTEHPVNGGLTEAQKAYATAACETESHLDTGVGRAATALTLKNRIRLDLFFHSSAIGTDYSDLYALAVYTDHYGNEVRTRVEGEDFVTAEGDCAYVSIPGLAAADYGAVVTCTVYDAEGNVLAWAADSIEGYAHRMAEQLPEMVNTIVKFGSAAYNYFH